MPQHATREDYIALSEKFTAYSRAVEAEIEDLRRENADQRRQLAEGKSAYDLGGSIQSHFPSWEAFEAALGTSLRSEDPGAVDIQPGQLPLSDLDAW
jgi:hypothetical protein